MMSNKVGERELFKDLHVVAPKWRMFGVFLKVPHNILKEFQGSDCVVDGCFMEILIRWLDNCTPEAKETNINQLVSALRFPGVDHMRLANEIDTNRAGVRLELDYLLEKLKSCKAKYYFLGLGLGLKGPDLKQIETTTRSCSPVKICFHQVLIFWLNSTHANLDILVKALENVNHRALAREIKEKYAGKTFVASKPEVTTPVTEAPNPFVAAQYHDIPQIIPHDTPGPVLDDPLHMKLEMKDHFKIASYLKDLPEEQLKQLGLVLGLYYPSLKKMETFPDDMVHAWLLRQDGVIEASGEPRFQSLATALEEIGQKGLALDVKQQKHAKRKIVSLSRAESLEERQVQVRLIPQNMVQDPSLPYGMECSESSSNNQKGTADNVSHGMQCSEASSNNQKGTANNGFLTQSTDAANPRDRTESDFWPNLLSLFAGKKHQVHKTTEVDMKSGGDINMAIDTEVDDKMIVVPAKDRGDHCANLKLDDDDKITPISPLSRSEIKPPEPGVVGFYPMKRKRHGVAIIINNKIFKYHKERKGTNRDEYNLIETWLFLGYCVVVLRNCSAKEMEKTFKNIDDLLTNIEDKEVAHDSFVCCILSHGNTGEVFGSDSESVEYRVIKEYISKSDILRSRPKLFFIQACQGKKQGRQRLEDRLQKDDGDISEYSDFYMSCATLDGDQSYRDIYTGTWYISELCQVLCENGKVSDLDDIQKTVNGRVVSKYKTPKGFAQQPHANDILRRKVFFFHE